MHVGQPVGTAVHSLLCPVRVRVGQLTVDVEMVEGDRVVVGPPHCEAWPW